MKLIEIKNLVKCYPKAKSNAINNLSFDIEQHEFLGLLGQNGSGKTTLISIICGLLSADSGRVKLFGQTCPLSDKKLQNKLALVPQQLALYPSLTLYENLLFIANLYNLDKDKIKKNIDNVLSLVQLENCAHDKVDTYSGGMKRRANLAMSLAHSPELIILDEPTVNVDPSSREIIFSGLKKMHNDGCTIIYTSHYMEEIEKLCNRVVVIDKGEMILDDKPQNLLNGSHGTDNLTDLFLSITRDKA